jgi:hypothetical protein
MFTRLLSEQPTNTVEVWPAWQDTNAFEASFGWPGNKATAENSMLHFIEGGTIDRAGRAGATPLPC